MRDNKVIATAAGVVALTSALGLAIALSDGFGPRFDSATAEAAGRALARQAVALLRPPGRITVITRDTATFQNPATDSQWASFRKELAKAGVKVGTVRAIQIDPLRPTAVPPGDFFQWIKEAKPGDVLVSFMGPPIFSEAQRAQLGNIQPAVVAFCPGPVRDQVDLRALFAQGLLKAAVVSKRGSGLSAGRPMGERETFDRQFIEITAANVALLSTNASP